MMDQKKVDIWIPIYIGDYLGDTLHLSTELHGAYFLMLLAYWRKGGSFPDDDSYLANVTKLSPNAWSNARSIIEDFFQISEGRWSHKRLERQLKESAELRIKSHYKAVKANEARWKGKDAERSEPDSQSQIINYHWIPSNQVIDAVAETVNFPEKFVIDAAIGFAAHFNGRKFTDDETISQLVKWTNREIKFQTPKQR